MFTLTTIVDRINGIIVGDNFMYNVAKLKNTKSWFSSIFRLWTGLPHVVLLTKVDKICPEVDDDVTNTHTSTAICEAVNKVAVIMGIPRAHVFPVKNYENETNLKLTLDILIMDALKRSLDFSNDFIDEQLHKLATEEKRYNTRDKVNQMKVS